MGTGREIGRWAVCASFVPKRGTHLGIDVGQLGANGLYAVHGTDSGRGGNRDLPAFTGDWTVERLGNRLDAGCSVSGPCGGVWRMGGDSNPRCRLKHTRFPGEHNRPLCHPSISDCRPFLWRGAGDLEAKFPGIKPDVSGSALCGACGGGGWSPGRAGVAAGFADLGEEIVALVVHEDERGEVFDLDLPDGFHPELRVL